MELRANIEYDNAPVAPYRCSESKAIDGTADMAILDVSACPMNFWTEAVRNTEPVIATYPKDSGRRYV